MRITYLKVKNFADIYAGLKRHSVEIDFSKSKNRVILFVGANGSGKTAILSKLHPFPYPGNMDVRNGSEMIIEGEDGYKEIHFLHEGDTFIIKHYYMFKSGKGVKSFISKNGVELNPNGNAGSFKELVYMHLGLEQEFMKLLRLGSNVTGFIDMKATERKNFTSDLLSDIDIYTKFYKKISDDSRMIKSLLRSVGEKIEKLRIYDEKEEQVRMEQLESELKTLQERRDGVNNNIGKITGSINTLVPNGLDNFIAEINMKESELKRLLSEINKVQSKMAKMCLVIPGDIGDEIKRVEQLIHMTEGKLTTNKNMIDFYFNQLNSLHSQREEKVNNLKYISSELDYSRLTELLLELHREKERLGDKFKNFNPKCTREDLLLALSLLQEIEKLIEDIHEFDETVVKNVVNHYLRGENVNYIVQKEVTKIDDRMARIHAELHRMNESAGVDPNAVYVLYVPKDSTCVCPYKKFYEDVMKGKKDSSREKLTSEQKSLEVKRERFLSYRDVAKKIDYILMIIKTNKTLIEKIPGNLFDIAKILNSIKGYTPFYDEDYITNFIALLEEYESYLELDKKIQDVQREKSFIEKNSTSLVSMQKELGALDNEIHKLDTELERLRSENNQLENSLERFRSVLDDYNLYKEFIMEIKEYETESERLHKDLQSMNDIRNRVREYLDMLRVSEQERDSIVKDIKMLEQEITSIKFRLMEFKTLNEEKAALEEKYDDIEIIKESLSSNKGIPLLFIQLYLKNTRVIVNNLLESVYKGDLEIADFIINDKEFRIPYIKNGITVPDAVYCSQGERSFISLALSFALIEQSIKGYNIMLLDEIDATLDQKNRYMFISILEKQLDIIGAEQVFLITHNNMFDNYPVDVIMTSDVNIDNYKNTNIIFKSA